MLHIAIIQAIIFCIKSLYYKELFCTFAIEIGYGGGDNSPLVC